MATLYSERMFSNFESELGACADKLGIPRALFHRPNVEYAVDSYFDLLDCGARNGHPDIGFRVGRSIKLTDIGVLGHAVQAASTVGEGINILSRYLFVLAHGNVVRVHSGQSAAIVSYGHTRLYPGLHQQDVELAMALAANLVRQLGRHDIDPERVEFAHSSPDHVDELEIFFGCKPVFNCRANRLHYPKSCLALPNPGADPSLLKALDFFLSERIKVRQEEEGLIDKVKHFIAMSLSDGTPYITAVAKILGMSPRTLQRRLAQEELVFTDLVDYVRHKIALEYVTYEDYSLTEVALMLGYSELSAFSRAFRRWEGRSPQQLREQVHENTKA
jgi:AraC-like DNA-binding protein